jgi:hypothetical protein
MKFIRAGPGVLSDNAFEETLILMGRRGPGFRPQAGVQGDNPCLGQEDQRLAIEAPELKVEEGRAADPEKIRDHQEARQRAVGPNGQESSTNGQRQLPFTAVPAVMVRPFSVFSLPRAHTEDCGL